MALVTVSDAAAIIGCARNSVYRKINRGELQAVEGPNGLVVEAEGLRDKWRRISRPRTGSPRPDQSFSWPMVLNRTQVLICDQSPARLE
jgi:hypothetical protein